MTDAALSIIRTYVPIAVGALAAWLLTLGVDVAAEAQAGLVVAITGILQAVYYAAARWLESRWPSLGVLLGSTKQPAYDFVAHRATDGSFTAVPRNDA